MKIKKRAFWQTLVGVLAFTAHSFIGNAQDFPILLHSNGTDLLVESMDVGPDGDIYVTGRTGSWNQFTLGACLGVDVVSPSYCPSPSISYLDIFVARFHPDASDLLLNDLVWMVIGHSSVTPSSAKHSGKDIEVDNDGNAYFAGTLNGSVNFKRVWPVCDPADMGLICCPSSNPIRSFAGKISASGTPIWVADTRMAPTDGTTFGEAITLDLVGNRLFTGGYVSANPAGGMVYARNSDCTDECSFMAVPTPSANVGFIAEYDLNGNNFRSGTVGERVMALKVDRIDHEHVWATGATYGSDFDVMLANVFMDVIPDPCINFTTTYQMISGVGDDMGLDIDQTGDGIVMFTGVYTSALNWFFGVPMSLTTIAGNSEIFVGRYAASFFGFTNTTLLTGGIPTSSSMNWALRSSCISADQVSPGSNRAIIGYNANDLGLIETQVVNTNLLAISPVDQISPFGSAGFSGRAMEIEFGPGGDADERYMAGDMFDQVPGGTGFDFSGVCVVGTSSTYIEGYITQMTPAHVITALILNTEEVEAMAGIELFPNPTNQHVTIRSDVDEISLKITDAKGNVLMERSNLSMGEHTLDISDFATGVYLVEVVSVEGRIVKQLIVN